jgi:fucose 4-O-acetylase-like acetyltransferase
MNPTLRQYSDSIFVAKGIAIILVVVGHYQPKHGPPYWYWLHDFIYTFHMPLFMFLSGFLFAASDPINSVLQYKNFIKNKAKRILVPFITLTIIIFILKFIGEMHYQLLYPISYKSFFDIFLNPIDSFAPILWFLYVLFEIFLIVPLIYFIVKKDIYALGCCFLLLFLPWSDLFMIGSLLFYLPIFIMGLVFFRQTLLKSNQYELGLCCIVLFGLLLASKHYFHEPDALNRIYRVVVGLLGSISAFFIARQISCNKNKLFKALKYVGIYSMGIYLLHTPIMNALRLFLSEKFELSGPGFLPFAIILIAISTGSPILLEDHLLRRSAIAARLVLGIKLTKGPSR